MIVKIRWGYDWIVYDGFDKVHYRHYSREEAAKQYADSEWNERGADKIAVERGKRDKPSWPVAKLICRKKDKNVDQQVSIKTDCLVYLLNDEGKTIEVINR